MQIYKLKRKQHYGSGYFIIFVEINRMNFTDFYKDIAKENEGIDQKQAKQILYSLQKKMEKKLKFGTEISIRNIGVLILRVTEPKKYRHFGTGKMLMSNRKYSLKLRVARTMTSYLKSKTVYGYEHSQKKEDI